MKPSLTIALCVPTYSLCCTTLKARGFAAKRGYGLLAQVIAGLPAAALVEL
jgi:hypothetical protein